MAASCLFGYDLRGDCSTTALLWSLTEPAGLVRWQRCCSAIGRSHLSLPWDEDLVCIIRRRSAASSERWPMARLRHLMTDRYRAKSRLSLRRPRPGWYLWPATRPRSTAIRMNCGRHCFWPSMRVSADRRRVTNVLPFWLKAPCASFSVKRKSSRTRCATIWSAATPSSSPRWRKFCVLTARSRS